MKKFTGLVLLLFLVLLVNAQTITTIAGNGGSTVGDGGPAVSAAIYSPYWVAFDSKGNTYITDGGHNSVRKVSLTGIITTVVGTGVSGYSGDNGPATAAKIATAVGLAFDPNDNLFICDYYNNRIRRIDTFGIITTVAGNGSASFNGDNIAATSAAVSMPHCIALDAAGNMYITEAGSNRVRKVNTTGTITTIAGNGLAGYAGDNGPATNASLEFPYGIALDAAGNVFFADSYYGVVRKIDAAGIITTIAGNTAATSLGDNGPATAANINGVIGIAISADNTMYLSSVDNKLIRKIEGGIITSFAGNGSSGFSGDGGPATAAQVNKPYGMAIEPSTNALIFCDYSNNRVRRVGWPTGINDVNNKTNEIKIYPNPSAGVFTCDVSSAKNEIYRVSIVDIMGRVVKEVIIEPGTPKEIKLEQPGVYILTAKGKTTTLLKRIMIVQ